MPAGALVRVLVLATGRHGGVLCHSIYLYPLLFDVATGERIKQDVRLCEMLSVSLTGEGFKQNFFTK